MTATLTRGRTQTLTAEQLADLPAGTMFAVRTHGWAARGIQFGMWLAGYGPTARQYNHVVCVIAPGLAVEGRPGGAGHVDLATYAGYDIVLDPRAEAFTAAQRWAAVQFWMGKVGTPYGWLDIAAQAWDASPLTTPQWVWKRVARTDRMICSQLAEAGLSTAGVPLLPWLADCEVSPADVAAVVLGEALPASRRP